jgi:hypothetical protein
VIADMVPIANLFDRTLNGATPPNNTLQSSVGLAEFTNANFVSADTIDPSPDLPSPDVNGSCVSRKDVLIPDPMNNGAQVARPYYWKTWDCVQDGENGYLLAGVGYFEFFMEESPYDYPGGSFTQRVAPMDDRVYDGYAKNLLPRAAGYSAVLLKYFFRGEMDAEGFGVTDSSGNTIALQFTVENKTPDEELKAGEFVVVYDYVDPLNGRQERWVSDAVSSGVIPSDGSKSTYLAYLPKGIPLGATDISYLLVYRGQLGYETDAVVGQVMNILSPVWAEHWNSLKGDHPWSHSGIDRPVVDASLGTVLNVNEAGALKKFNTRFQGSTSAQVNESLLDLNIPIRPTSLLMLKLDEMEMVPMLGLQECSDNPWQTPAYQEVRFRFKMGESGYRTVNYTVDGHVDPGNNVLTSPGAHNYIDIYTLLSWFGAIVEPVTLTQVVIGQQIMPLCVDVASDQTQSLSVDYIRVLDEI